MDQWVVVLDADPVSRRQLEVCKALRPSLAGAIQCDLSENEDAKICTAVHYFPAFCNVTHNQCSYGLRATRAELEALTEFDLSPQTTPQDPPPTAPEEA